MRHLLDANVCVARNAGFYTPFHTERAAEGLQRTPHKTPCRGTIHLDAGPGLHIARLTRSCLDPSSPKRYVAQVYRPAHDRAGNHVQQHCRVSSHGDPRKRVSRTNPIDGATSSRRASMPMYKNCIHRELLEPPKRAGRRSDPSPWKRIACLCDRRADGVKESMDSPS